MIKFGKFHDKYYKLLLLVPIAILLFSLVYLFVFNAQNDSFIYKDVSLTGGTSVTIYGDWDKLQAGEFLKDKLDDVSIKQIYNFSTGDQVALIIETKSDMEISKINIEEFMGEELKEGVNSNMEFTGSSLSESFYKQLLIAVFIAFVFMALVVFLLFRTMIPSLAVILSAITDIIMTLMVVNLLGIKMSTAGIVAFLMLIGYSVDTDILLTNRILKRGEGTINDRIYGAFKTGITMTLTSLTAIVVAFIIIKPFSGVLTQIFTILIIGLSFDILNTWITNVSIIKWYANKK